MLDQQHELNRSVAVAKNYSLTMLHIAKVADLAQRLSISQGEVVRRAIDLLWEQEETNEMSASPTEAA